MCEFNEKMEFEECIEDTLNTPEFFSKFEEDDREVWGAWYWN